MIKKIRRGDKGTGGVGGMNSAQDNRAENIHHSREEGEGRDEQKGGSKTPRERRANKLQE